MAKYSALILLVTLAVFWSSAEAKYNRYQQDVIDAMTNWGIEELRDLDEPYKSRFVSQLNEAKNRHWNDLGEYFRHIMGILQNLQSQLRRYRRGVEYSHRDNKNLRKVSTVMGKLSQN